MYTVLNVFCSMSTLSIQVCRECNKFNCIHVDTVEDKFVRNVISSIVFMSTLSIHVFCISAIRTVAAGHRMVAEGWTLFEQTCEEVGPGELPQLLRQLKSATTPSPGPSTPVKTEPMEEEEVQQPEGAEPEAKHRHQELMKHPL